MIKCLQRILFYAAEKISSKSVWIINLFVQYYLWKFLYPAAPSFSIFFYLALFRARRKYVTFNRWMTDANLTCIWHLQSADSRQCKIFREILHSPRNLSPELPIKLFTHEKTSREINDETPWKFPRG